MWDNKVMQDLKQRYLAIERGSTLKQWFRCKNPYTGATYNLTTEGYTAGYLQIRDATAPDDGELLLNLNTANGGVVFEYVANDGAGQSWSGYIYASANATKNLPEWEDAVYDFIAYHGSGHVDTISRGPALLIPNVTVL